MIPAILPEHRFEAQIACCCLLCRYKIGPEKGRIIEAVARQALPTTAVELGSFVGYSAIRIARNLGRGGRLVCVEGNPECVQAMEGVLSHAGVRDLIVIEQGLSGDVVPTLAPKYGPAQFLFEDHCKPCYLPDLKTAEQGPSEAGRALVGAGCWVLAGEVGKGVCAWAASPVLSSLTEACGRAWQCTPCLCTDVCWYLTVAVPVDNVVYPGTPDLLDYLGSSGLYEGMVSE
jgi:hypothetical protein